MAGGKPHMNLVFIGHVDHGKSTTVGRILYDSGAIDEQTLKKMREEAEKVGKATFEFAFLMDRMKEERERGVTIDVAHKDFQTQKYYFTIIDAPGHRDFIKNMITGASQADAAVLVVAAPEGVMDQTKEHAFLAYTLGIKQVIVAINKMDAVNYDQKKYNEVKEQVANLLKTYRYDINKVPFIPISAYKGDNVVKKSTNMSWYSGPTLVEALDTLEVPKKPTDKPLRIPVQDVYTITGIGTVPVGRVETGILKVGDSVIFNPAGAKGEVKSIEMHHQPMQQAEPGDNIGFNVRGISKKDVKRGDVCGPVNNPPTVVKEFKAMIVILKHPSAITAGYTPVFHAHTAQVACTISEIVGKLDPKTGQPTEEKPKFLKAGDTAVVKVRPTKPMVIETYKEFPPLGRFAIRDMGMTIGAGQVIEVTPREQ